jgi:hypothetical protein
MPPNPNYGGNYFDQNRKNSHASTSDINQSRAIVPQKNMAHGQDFCSSYKYSYARCMCQKDESFMDLTVKEPTIEQSCKEDQSRDASYMQRQGDCSFMNHQVEEHCNVNQDSIAHNTRRKKRAMEDATAPPPNQASTSNATSHVQVVNDQSNTLQQQRKNNGRKDISDPQVVPSQSPTIVAPKASAKVSNTPFNVVKKMKKTNVNISMWDVVTTIPMQNRLL